MIAEPSTLEDAMRTAERIGSAMTSAKGGNIRGDFKRSTGGGSSSGIVPMELGTAQ
jgi:hypothetical protein